MCQVVVPGCAYVRVCDRVYRVRVYRVRVRVIGH